MKANTDDPLIAKLYTSVRFMVRILAVMMAFVIVMGVVDVGWTIYQKLITPPMFILTISDMLASFGAFMAVLIAIEILINITIYLREDVIHVKIVMATALMAIARKVIVLDFTEVSPEYVYGIGVVVIAMSIGYWLIHNLPKDSHAD
ncbi:phosphate-starvation-inducible PsiE family protein [Aestuariibacter sp. AA17]|uniref:Phosphate-starvation-inducible PsiE family protein n=1 Tax=Fluctibacter corallii TaxID=2984329 RepID=A0ABT3A8D1_9ALTE|nr:phosphate-starvation-inducible PsiE family protein [Aestuariibacter sp. AA17]MCV2884542.1 phosphate-starvation-inducible PsiE family protein [Aestuariibacter sp. AA17]